ncbi:MAG: division/cell wall cluster transcriptional repressor MraZ [Flavobacteriales bacterium]|nr:division/cell wall cluster transcriptional repressor MraZ [Flavobacteriales bacterium]
MINLLGEYDCKIDSKGRFMFPAGLKKQLGTEAEKGFVVNRNLHADCLVVYPIDEWEKLNRGLRKLNRLIKKNDDFVRRVMGGATPVSLDGVGRFLVPKPLASSAEIVKEVAVVGSGGVIEIWNKSKRTNAMSQDLDIEALAEEVMGDVSFGDE